MIADIALKSVLISALGLAIAGVLRKGSAAARHFVLAVTLAGVCALPAVSLLLPRWHVPFLKVGQTLTGAQIEVEAMSPAASHPGVVQASMPAVTPSTLLVLLWGVVAAVLMVGLAIRLMRLRRLEGRLQMTADPTLLEVVAMRCRETGIRVLLLDGPASVGPMTWGCFRPVLTLPSEASAWPEDRLNAVVLHELAHVERGDWLKSVVAQVACAVYWFNPLVWLIKQRLELESEAAADDSVLAFGVSASEYAGHLVDVTKHIQGRPLAGAAAFSSPRRKSLESRVRAILEARRCRTTIRGAAALSLIAVIAVLVLTIGVAAPALAQDPLNPAIDIVYPTVAANTGSDAQSPDPVSESTQTKQPTVRVTSAPVAPRGLESYRYHESRLHAESTQERDAENAAKDKACTEGQNDDEGNSPDDASDDSSSSSADSLGATAAEAGSGSDVTADVQIPSQSGRHFIIRANNAHIEIDGAQIDLQVRKASREIKRAVSDAQDQIRMATDSIRGTAKGVTVDVAKTVSMGLEVAGKIAERSVKQALREAEKAQKHIGSGDIEGP